MISKIIFNQLTSHLNYFSAAPSMNLRLSSPSSTQFLKINDPLIQYGLGLLAGGGVAGTIQAGTSLLRLGSTKFTGGIGNGFLSTFENIISI